MANADVCTFHPGSLRWEGGARCTALPKGVCPSVWWIKKVLILRWCRTESMALQREKVKKGQCGTETGEHRDFREMRKVWGGPSLRARPDGRSVLSVAQCVLPAFLRDRAFRRKVFSSPWASAGAESRASLRHTWLVPGRLRLDLLNPLPSVRAWGAHLPAPPHRRSLTLHPLCTLQIFALFMWLRHKKCQQPLYETPQIVLTTPIEG